jgi:riboflavin kinase/FMN adenylyltransferase
MPTLSLGWMTHPPAEYLGGALAIGNFDGVHRGHVELVRAAKRLGRPAIAVTFDPPPVALLHPPSIKPPLTTNEDRAALLHSAGADAVVMLRTDPGLLALTPEAFFEDVVRHLFEAKGMAEGYNFRFGRKRVGDVETLRSLCQQHGVQLDVVPPVLDGGEPISSSRIRTALAEGNVADAARGLGRPYSIRGIVEAGAKRGRTIGFPTANLGHVRTLIPKDGVYAGRIGDHAAAVNIGSNPTFGEFAQKVEVHLIDFNGDLYGQELNLEFVKRLRDTRPFSGVTELVEQLKRDVEEVRRSLLEFRL